MFTASFLDGTRAIYIARIDDCNGNEIDDAEEIANGTLRISMVSAFPTNVLRR